MKDDVRRAARTAEANPVMRVLARCGFAANGVVHALIGIIVLVVAFGGDGESDQAGALKAIAAAPLGFLVLWIIAIALWALAAWHVLEGILARRDSTAAKWGVRASEWSQAAVYAVIGLLAASVALGARPDPDEAAQDASRGVLFIPGGPFVLGAVGLAIGIGGVVFIAMGLRRDFENKMDIPGGAFGVAVKALGVVGFVGKGLALVILAVLLVVAAVRVDPNAAGGLDAAIGALIVLPYGPWLASAVGVGLIVYGVFCGFRARYASI